jgi:hypothetical protein
MNTYLRAARNPRVLTLLWLGGIAAGAAALIAACAHVRPSGPAYAVEARVEARDLVSDGKQIFRYDTFGSEAFWGDQLGLHKAIAGEKLGGVGPGITPNQALALGLKVDSDAVPRALGAVLLKGLDDPQTTVALLRANAVVGLTGVFSQDGKQLRAVGIQCALCHSTVDDSFLKPGIGKRLDGWPNRDLDIGKIVSAAPDLRPFTDMLQVDEATVKKVLGSWGPGKFDALLNLDGKAFRPDGGPAATLNPAAFGLAGVNQHTWTGSWGTVSYWNAYVANLEMHGKGNFYDPRFDDEAKYPVAARTRQGHKRDAEDLITSKLPALHAYQLSLPVPTPPANVFDREAAGRGERLFNTKARCAECHVPPLYTEPGYNLHTPAEIGIDDFQASRSPDGRYRTAPLRALWSTDKIHKGGYYHDGRFGTLMDVVNHYDGHFRLNLSPEQKRDLIEFLKSL